MFQKIETLQSYSYACRNWKNFLYNRIFALLYDTVWTVILLIIAIFLVSIIKKF